MEIQERCASSCTRTLEDLYAFSDHAKHDLAELKSTNVARISSQLREECLPFFSAESSSYINVNLNSNKYHLQNVAERLPQDSRDKQYRMVGNMIPQQHIWTTKDSNIPGHFTISALNEMPKVLIDTKREGRKSKRVFAACFKSRSFRGFTLEEDLNAVVNALGFEMPFPSKHINHKHYPDEGYAVIRCYVGIAGLSRLRVSIPASRDSRVK